MSQYRFDHRKVKAARLATGLKREHAAVATNRTKELIASVECGRVAPTMPVILKLCDLYGIEPADLLVEVDGEDEAVDAVRRLRVESRRAQGLPDAVEDAAALTDGAEILSGATRTEA
jgi:transcriptional regulator with XRE-family HTH domain